MLFGVIPIGPIILWSQKSQAQTKGFWRRITHPLIPQRSDAPATTSCVELYLTDTVQNMNPQKGSTEMKLILKVHWMLPQPHALLLLRLLCWSTVPLLPPPCLPKLSVLEGPRAGHSAFPSLSPFFFPAPSLKFHLPVYANHSQTCQHLSNYLNISNCLFSSDSRHPVAIWKGTAHVGQITTKNSTLLLKAKLWRR